MIIIGWFKFGNYPYFFSNKETKSKTQKRTTNKQAFGDLPGGLPPPLLQLPAFALCACALLKYPGHNNKNQPTMQYQKLLFVFLLVIMFVLFMAYLALLEPRSSLGSLSAEQIKHAVELKSTREAEEENRSVELAGVEKLLEEVVVLQKQHQQRLMALENETHSAIESLKEQEKRNAAQLQQHLHKIMEKSSEAASFLAKQENKKGRFCSL